VGFFPGTGGFRAAPPLLEPLPSLFSVDPLEPLDPFDEPLALDETLAVDDEDDDSLESYFLTGFGGDGSSSQFTQPSLLC